MPLVSTSYLSFVPRGVFFWVVKRKEGASQHLDRVDLPGGDGQEENSDTGQRAEGSQNRGPSGRPGSTILSYPPLLTHAHVSPVFRTPPNA